MIRSLLGTKVGHFRFVARIAAGGMGEVYEGYDETLQRKVALKGIRPEYRLNGEAKSRFLREARVLSQLGHPNICLIYDYLEGGESDFIVMELVEGRSLAQAVKRGLDEQAKMRIAEQVAGVLVAAHGKGVIHRDLKPDNVMLAEGDHVKVLDFGLSRRLEDEYPPARPGQPEPEMAPPPPEQEDDATYALSKALATGPSTAPTASLTTAGAVMGTIGYMSPEQARGEVVTAASDMFSFGLMLQELFTGKPPYDPGLGAKARLERARRGETAPLAGLDAELAALIARLESAEPAARPSAVDVAEKLEHIRTKPLRRRRRLLVAGAMIVLAAFGAAMAVQSVRATRAEKRAREEAETAKQVSAFLVGLFQVSDPGEARGRTITAREILDRGAMKVGTELKSQPLVRARLLSTIGTVYTELGLYEEAEPLLSSALAIRERTLGPEHPEVASTLDDVGDVNWNRGRFAEAERLYRRALAIKEKALGPEDPGVATSLNNLANVYENQGRYAEAEPLYKRALAIDEKAHGPDSPDVALHLNNLANDYEDQGKFAEAQPLYERALAIQEKALGPDHPEVATALYNLGSLYYEQGKYGDAEPLFHRALAIREKTLGPDHARVAVSLNGLASLYCGQGRYAEAEPLFQRALAIREKTLGPDHPEVATSLYNLGSLYRREGRDAEAEPLLQRSLAISEKALGPDHPDVAGCLRGLAEIRAGQGRYQEAERLDARALSVEEKALGPEDPLVADSLSALADLCRLQGRSAEARRLLERCLAVREKAFGARSREAAETIRALGSCELWEKMPASALERAELCTAIARELSAKAPGDRRLHALVASGLLLKGQALSATGREAEAQSAWKEALTEAGPADKAQGASDRSTRAQLLLCLGRKAEAKPLVEKLLDGGFRSPDLIALCREKGLAPK